MKSIYKKDLNIIRIVFLITLIFSIFLISYCFNIYYLPKRNLFNNRFSVNIVYNYGKNACILKETNSNNIIDYIFSVIGYNKTNHDIKYKIVASEGTKIKNYTRLSDSNVMINLKENNLKYNSFVPIGLTDFGILLSEITIPANSDSFINEYKIEMMKSDKIVGDIGNYFMKNTYYSVKVDIKIFT